jgi:hypothetical protein
MSLAPTPLLDTLVQLANNDINPNNFDLNDPAALAMAAVAAVDAEEDPAPEGDAASTCSSVDSGGVGGLSSFSEQVSCCRLPMFCDRCVAGAQSAAGSYSL